MTGLVLHAAESGSAGASPVLLLGSLGTTHRMWDPQVAALEEHHRVIALDLRGHGRSPAPPGPYALADLGTDVLATLDELGLARASVVGLSIGGMVALWLAAHAPERVDRLVVLCSSAHVPPPERWRERAATVRSAGTTAPIADAVIDRWLTPGATVDREALRSMLLAQPAEGYAACCDALAGVDLREDLARIVAPTLVVSGAQDEAIRPDHQQRLAKGIAGARLEVLSPGAHIVSIERPEEVSRLLLDHLEDP